MDGNFVTIQGNLTACKYESSSISKIEIIIFDLFKHYISPQTTMLLHSMGKHYDKIKIRSEHVISYLINQNLALNFAHGRLLSVGAHSV